MKKFYLIANKGKQNTRRALKRIEEYLTLKGASCLVSESEEMEEGRRAGNGFKYTDPAGIPGDTDCVITLGGDGTLIQAARDLAGLNIPMLGINLGTLGYLTQGSDGEIPELLDALLEDRYVLERRLMLEGRMEGRDGTRFRDVALNELVVTRKDSMKVTKLSISVNGRFFSSYTANGVILSTPTGSTAYNLSAGGPISAPNCRIMILTPICSHTLNLRSIVVCGDDTVRIEIVDGEDGEQAAVFDGDTAVDMSRGDVIEISRSAVETTLVKLNDISFMDNLRRKMAGI